VVYVGVDMKIILKCISKKYLGDFWAYLDLKGRREKYVWSRMHN